MIKNQDSAYLTEVHHINGEGEDAGIVYSEMQSRETTGDSIVHREMTRALYPGRSGYKSVTGGLVKNLRESTSNEKVSARALRSDMDLAGFRSNYRMILSECPKF